MNKQNKQIDEKIARKICGKTTLELIGDRYGDWSPSTNIGHAIEALKCLPKELSWRFDRWAGGGSQTYFCVIWADDFSPYLAYCEDKNDCQAICRALLSPKVIAAVRMARKAVRR